MRGPFNLDPNDAYAAQSGEIAIAQMLNAQERLHAFTYIPTIKHTGTKATPLTLEECRSIIKRAIEAEILNPNTPGLDKYQIRKWEEQIS